MYFKRVCTLFFPILMCGLVFSGCSFKSVNANNTVRRVKIGFSMDTLKEERWYKDKTDFVSQAKKQNADTLVEVDYDNSDKQYEQVKDMVSKGIDVLVIVPHDTKIAADAVKYAKGKGVKVICYDRLVSNAGADLYISFDNVKVGELQADSIVKSVNNGNYVIVNGPSADYNTVMIDKGIMNVLEPYVKSGKIKIIKQIEVSDWMADEAYACIANLINGGEKIDAVIAENDSLAGGVIDALSEKRLISSVPVAGMDADLAACQRIAEGQQLMTVFKPIGKRASAAVDYAVKMAKGEKIDIKDQINDGTYDIPYYKIKPVAVTKENMASTVIKDGFHSTDEVYMNIPQSERSPAKQKKQQ